MNNTYLMAGSQAFSVDYIWGTTFIFIAMAIIISNIYNIVVILKLRQLRGQVTGLFMVSLAFADLLVGVVIGLPIINIFVTNGKLVYPLCQVASLVHSTSLSVSIYMLGFLSVDRYIAITHPLHYNTCCTKKRANVALVTVWGLCFAFWMLNVLGVSRVIYVDIAMLCNPDPLTDPALAITAVIVIFLITSAVILFCYINILIVVIKQSKQIVPEGGGRGDGGGKIKSRVKGIRTLLLIVSGFYLAWTPFCIEWVIAIVDQSILIPGWLQRLSRLLCNSNSFWNAIIYTATNSQFRRAALGMLGCRTERDRGASESIAGNGQITT